MQVPETRQPRELCPGQGRRGQRTLKMTKQRHYQPIARQREAGNAPGASCTRRPHPRRPAVQVKKSQVKHLGQWEGQRLPGVLSSEEPWLAGCWLCVTAEGTTAPQAGRCQRRPAQGPGGPPGFLQGDGGKEPRQGRRGIPAHQSSANSPGPESQSHSGAFLQSGSNWAGTPHRGPPAALFRSSSQRRLNQQQ